jgi:peroxin-1
MTEGYAPADMKDLVDRAVHRAVVRCSSAGGPTTLTLADFEKAKEGFIPVSLRDVPLQTSEVAWSDIGGASSEHSA